MAMTASEQTKGSMMVEEMSSEPGEGLKASQNDQRDMFRMGKIQELRVKTSC